MLWLRRRRAWSESIEVSLANDGTVVMSALESIFFCGSFGRRYD